MFSCKTDNTLRGELDGVWTSDIFDMQIQGNIGTLVRFHQISTINIAQVGDTVVADLKKISKENFIGMRIFLQNETNEMVFATFKIQEKEGERIMTSIIADIDTVYFRN